MTTSKAAMPLLIVDVQNGFINDFTRHIPSRIAEIATSGRYDPVMFTQFVNSPESPFSRFIGWDACSTEEETALVPDIAGLADGKRVFTKPGFAGAPDDLRAYLRETGVEGVTIVGMDTDMCVLKIAMDVFDLGILPIVLIDCCASTAGLQAHLAGLAVLARNIGAHQLHDAGLGGGQLAAP